MLRKKATLEDYASLDQSVTFLMPYKNPAHLEFYGQRHWRPNRLSLEPSDMKTELEGLAGLLHRDRMEVDLMVTILFPSNKLISHSINFKYFQSSY